MCARLRQEDLFKRSIHYRVCPTLGKRLSRARTTRAIGESVHMRHSEQQAAASGSGRKADNAQLLKVEDKMAVARLVLTHGGLAQECTRPDCLPLLSQT